MIKDFKIKLLNFKSNIIDIYVKNEDIEKINNLLECHKLASYVKIKTYEKINNFVGEGIVVVYDNNIINDKILKVILSEYFNFYTNKINFKKKGSYVLTKRKNNI